MEIEKIKITDIKPAEYNPRKHTTRILKTLHNNKQKKTNNTKRNIKKYKGGLNY